MFTVIIYSYVLVNYRKGVTMKLKNDCFNPKCKKLQEEYKRYILEKERELDNFYIELNWYKENYG